MNNELYHWKYKSRKKVNGKWRYEYDTKKVSTNRSGVPEAYKPNLKKSTYAGRNGYTNDKGLFFAGDYESARKQSYEWDLKQADSKAKSQLKEQQYRSSAKRHVDDAIKDAKNTAKKISYFSQKQIDKGRNWLIKKLSK